MKKTIFSFLLVFMFVTLGLVTNAAAIGFGMYYNTMSGSSDWDVDSDIGGDFMDYDDSDDWDGDEETTSFGFVFDTNLARNELFNYRFELGLENSDVDLDIEFGDIDTEGTAELSGLVMTHDFGFGVFRTKDVRIWIGPEVKLSFLSGEIDVDGARLRDVDCDVNIFKFGLGPVAGLNFNIDPQLSLSIKVGVLLQNMTGEGDVDITAYDFLGNEVGHPSGDQEYEASDTYFFINFSIFYRMNDHF